jgi:bifunctional non-homologous end joining protein LigD
MSAPSEVWQVEGHALELSHLDKLFWPDAGFTKRDMLSYYQQIAPAALPHFRDRPVTLRVFPEGTQGESFYQRERPPYAPPWLAGASYHPRTRSAGAGEPHAITTPLVSDSASLLWLANGGCVEFHLWSSRIGRLDQPDQAIFDLDPGERAPFAKALEAALRLHDQLEQAGIASYPKTSGGHGIHVYAPLAPVHLYMDVRQWVKATAQRLAEAHPTLVAVGSGSTHRGDYVTIDYAQNSIGRNTAAPYTIRAGAFQPRVSTPLRWEEIASGGIHPADMTPQVALERVRRLGDLFAPALLANQRLPARP